jgi:hypothetical protein
MTSVMIPCASCTRFHRENDQGETCTAFPTAIPREILYGGHDHRTPFEGDGGIQWEPVPGMEFLAEED